MQHGQLGWWTIIPILRNTSCLCKEAPQQREVVGVLVSTEFSGAGSEHLARLESIYLLFTKIKRLVSPERSGKMDQANCFVQIDLRYVLYRAAMWVSVCSSQCTITVCNINMRYSALYFDNGQHAYERGHELHI